MPKESTSTANLVRPAAQKIGLSALMMPDVRKGNPYQVLLSKALEELGCTVSFPGGYRRVFPLFRALREQAQPVSVLHLHWLSPYLRGTNSISYLVYALKLYLDILLVRRSGTHIVWTIHNRISHESRFPRIERLAMRLVARAASRIIIHSNAALTEIQVDLRLDPGKTAVIPHGHYREVYHAAIDRQSAKRRLALAADSFVYLCFGLIRRYKNIEGLLKAWKNNGDLPPRSVLLVAGESQDPVHGAEIRSLAEDCSNVILHSRHIPADQVHLYFSAADVVVLPFEKTLTSGSLLLAMSFDKPVIGPRLSVISETIGAAADLLYDPFEENALGQALSRAPSLNLVSLAQTTRRQCDAANWDNIAEATVSTYEAACLGA